MPRNHLIDDALRPEHLPVREAADLYGIDRTTLYRWIRLGVVRGIRNGRGSVWVEMESLRQQIEPRPTGSA